VPPPSDTPRTWQSEWDVAELIRQGPNGDGEWPDVDPREVRYGDSLTELAEQTEYLGDLLEAAAIAGLVNMSVLDGVRAVLRAHRLNVLGEIGDMESQDALGDAIGWCDAGLLRAMVSQVEDMIAELELRAAELYGKPSKDPEAEAKSRKRWERWALAAEERAARARARAADAQADTDRYLSEAP
jgi:hypothetical protein